jgi:hypothetical protein
MRKVAPGHKTPGLVIYSDEQAGPYIYKRRKYVSSSLMDGWER